MNAELRLHFLDGVLAVEAAAAYLAQVETRFSKALTEEPADRRLVVEQVPWPLAGVTDENPVVDYTPHGGRLTSSWYRLEQYNDDCRVLLRNLNVIGLGRVLMQWTAMLLLPPDGALFHAAGFVTPSGRGCLATGRSEAGKTTLARNLLESGWSVLSDEAPALLLDVEGPRVLYTPFCGDLGIVSPRQKAAPLSALMLLEKGPRIELERLEPPELLRGLLRTVVSYGNARRFSSRIIDTLRDLAVAVPGYRISLPRELDAVELEARLTAADPSP